MVFSMIGDASSEEALQFAELDPEHWNDPVELFGPERGASGG